MSKIYDALIKAGKRNVTFSLEGGETIRHLSLSWQDISLEWKIVGTIGTLMLVLGLLSVATVNQLMGQALRTQIDQRALVIATNLSEAAAGHVIGRKILELHALVTKYGRLEGAAYAFIEDREGKILAHSLETFSPDLQKALTFDERRQVERRVVRSQGRAVYEIRTPMLEGQVGAAHVGMWGDGVETEIYSAIFPIVALITIVFLAGVILFIFLARGIIRAHPPADRYGG